jgi:beta-N-acetylhexosaminidase
LIGCGSVAGPSAAGPESLNSPIRAIAAKEPTLVARRPRITNDLIPFPASRKAEMRAYSERHYGLDTYRLRHPRVIVIHYAVAPSAQAVYNTFAPDRPDPELHELPNVCSHFVVDADGTIDLLVPLGLMCRHTVGLNYTAIGIEHAGFSDRDILRRPAQLRASLALTAWLRCRFHIKVSNVIGHNESLSSPYHHERVARLRTQTHGDWTHRDMQVYRRRLAKFACR